jgi:arylsulfatase A-like enzyme
MPARGESRAPTGRHGRLVAIAAAVAAIAASLAPASAPAAPKGKAKGDKPSKEKLQKQREANRRQKRPNVIVVMTDDQDASMEGLSRTVRLIGSAGTTFSNSYVSFPLCCPSRATFLTGQFSHNHGVRTSSLPGGYNALDHTNTLATWLQAAGYRTGMIGKYLNGSGVNDGIPEPVKDAKQIPPGWSEWHSFVSDSDQRRYRYKLNENGKLRRYGKGKRNYITDVLNAKAVDFVEENAPRKKPFFLWYNPTAPHGEAGRPFGADRNPTPARRHYGLFEGSFRPRTPNFNEADVSDKPSFVRSTPQLGSADVLDMDQRYRGRVESLLSLDQGVKRIFTRLRKAKDLGKTYVFFTSDNGLLLGAHRLVLKNYLYEEDARVPLLVRGPKFPRGVVRDQPVSNIDLAPTIVELTGATPGRTMDGRSLLGPANSSAVGLNREILIEHTDGDAALRSGDGWVYIRRVGQIDELYDLRTDPFQLNNQLYVDFLTPGVDDVKAAELGARLEQYERCAGSSCP